ncbi:hypothetical protein GCM10027085_13420 [Spirosoma aerophilum]
MGVLFDLTDSTLILAPIHDLKAQINTLLAAHRGVLPPTDSLMSVLSLRAYRYAQIRRITLHRRGSGGKGFLLGAGIGIGLVLSAGGGSRDGYTTPVQNALAGVVLFGIPGAIIGASITKHIDARTYSVASETEKRFRTNTIVDQVKKATLYVK